MDKKTLSLPILVSLVVGNMIGTGIYVLPSSLAEYGTISILSWAYTSIGALFLALTFANLNKRLPKTGGPYAYCNTAFGRPIGFIIAYTYWISNLVSIAGIAVSSITYLGFVFPALNGSAATYSPYAALVCELMAIWLFTLINIVGIQTAGILQLFLTIIKIIPLFIIALIGFFNIHLHNLIAFTPAANTSSFANISSAAALSFWAFIGLESATVPAENTQGPKDIYKATVYGTLITAFIYIISTIVLMGMIPLSQLQHSQFPFAEAGTLLFGPYAAFIVVILAVISGLGALNVCILVQGQIVFAAARDRLFPQQFAKISKRGVPIAGQLLSSGLVTLFLLLTMRPNLLEQFNNIIMLAALLTLMTYMVSALAEIKFAIQEKNIKYHHKTILCALLAALYAVWMISSLDFKIIGAGLLLVFLCLPIYFIVVKKYTEAAVD